MGHIFSNLAKYKSRRGEPDWFEILLKDDYQDIRNLILAAPVEDQQAIIEVFDGLNLFEKDDSVDAEIWLSGITQD